MPKPRPGTAFPIAAALAAQGLRVDQVDPDLLKFLQHVRHDGNLYAFELPARGDGPETPAANGAARSSLAPSSSRPGRGRRAEQEIPPADGPQWYETADMDEDYRKFWRRTRIVDGRPVLQVGEGKVVRYGLDAVPVRLSEIADWAEKNGWWKEVPAVAASGEDGDGVEVEEEDKVAPMMVSPVRDSPPRWRKKKVEQGQKEKGGAGKINSVNREDNMLSVVPVEKLNIVYTETNLSNGLEADPHIAAGFYGVVWPTHIMERPESSFKKKLLCVLRKPCCPEEYKNLFAAASNRLPATKRRQTRRGVKYYNSPHETNQSYFDSHPEISFC
ncbi:uncharacterized protein LOC124671532 [Lolium rigidum]|uniref:uncharacterized protein LOC124671532 n=1 Tax=Lolium rigidum TaxID=89674 RepID=UPI001F5E2ECE|nr:uncharacterized protein LOC124671532 [Lolium rigidum]